MIDLFSFALGIIATVAFAMIILLVIILIFDVREHRRFFSHYMIEGMSRHGTK